MLVRLLMLLCAIGMSMPLAQAREPFENAADTQNIDDKEQRLWYASRGFQKAIRRGGRLHPSPELQAYLQSVMDKLYPEFDGMIKVHVIDSHVLNAFAIPNGGIYMHTGMLARFDNEAQLATVLAHEGAHFIYRHGYYNSRRMKTTSGFATIAGVIGVPPMWNMLGNMLMASSIYGYSRELETEADNVGYERLKRAGYDVSEAAKTFEHLATEVRVSEIKQPVFFSTHPKLQNRIKNFNTLAANAPAGGEKHTERYASFVRELRLAGLKNELSLGRYKHIIHHLSDEAVFDRYPPSAHYYLAESYRKRNMEGDAHLAMIEAEISIARQPDFAPAYRTKGLLLMTQGDKPAAIEAFNAYLLHAPQAQDKSYIESYITMLKPSEKNE